MSVYPICPLIQRQCCDCHCWNVLLTWQKANTQTSGESHQSPNANDLTQDGDDDSDVEYVSSTTATGDSAAMHIPLSVLLYDVGHGTFQGKSNKEKVKNVNSYSAL